MSKYNPKAVRTQAAILDAVATVTVILAAISGFLAFIFGMRVAVMVFGEMSQALGIIVSVIYGGLTFFAGYLASLVIRCGAHLMLAIVEIEANTGSSSRRPGDSNMTEELQSDIHAEPESILTDEQLMEKYGITFDGEKYHYRNYQYRRLSDAVNYAEMQTDA